MVGSEGHSLRKTKPRFDTEGLPTPGDKRYWSETFIREVVKDDVYRAHSFEEIEALVATEVAARLDPNKSYGIWWFKPTPHVQAGGEKHAPREGLPQKEEGRGQAAERVDRRACAGRWGIPRVGRRCPGSH